MAGDVGALMAALGHDRFAVVGHDRGALVGHRLALDSPEADTHLAVLDVLPQLDMWAAMNRDFGLAGYHLFFLAQPADFPERLIGADPDLFLTHTLRSWCGTDGAITGQALAAYREAFADPRTIHATCEDYRAGATVDVDHDGADATRAGASRRRCCCCGDSRAAWSCRSTHSRCGGGGPPTLTAGRCRAVTSCRRSARTRSSRRCTGS
jgi:haloacetate dehalogenase